MVGLLAVPADGPLNLNLPLLLTSLALSVVSTRELFTVLSLYLPRFPERAAGALTSLGKRV